MDPGVLQQIIVEALNATHRRQEIDLGTVPVSGLGGRAWTLYLYLERTDGQPTNLVLQGEEGILGA